MTKSRVAVAIVLIFLLAVLLPGAFQSGGSSRASFVPAAPVTFSAPLSTHGTVTTAAPIPLVGFPRAVLVETFTGVWCPHCPYETEALHYIDQNTSANVLSISELHICAFAAGQGPCLDNYVPPDGTTAARSTFYNICGYPDVYFDGLNDSCGTPYTEPVMHTIYQDAILNASKVAAPVGITQSAALSSDNVTEHAVIASDVNGTYNTIMYLLEMIDKTGVQNGNGPHDVDRVVRETMYNHPVTLVAGGTTYLNVTSHVNSTWNDRNLSVVTFVQLNSSKQVENANMTKVSTVTTAIAANNTTLLSGGAATINVHVANSSTGAALTGVVVNFSWSGGGTVSPASGITDGSGNLVVSYQAPSVLATTTVVINAQVTAANYTAVPEAATIVVNPIIRPDVPTGFSVGAGNQQVSLNWTTPASGGAGVTYHIFRSSSQTGVYSQVSASSATSFIDTTVIAGQVYWYKMCAENTGGYSANTTAASATSVTVDAQGLPPNVGWWFSIDSLNVSAPTSSSFSLYLPAGFVDYQFAPQSYAWVASGSTGPVSVAAVPLVINATFIPRYASLQGTVSPSDASVTVNGTAVSVVAGAFGELLAAGTYSLNITAPGFKGNVTTVTLTPGNITNVTIALHNLPSSGSSPSSSSGLTTDEMIGIAVGVIIAAAIIGGAVMMSGKGKRGRSPPTGRKAPRGPSPPSGNEP